MNDYKNIPVTARKMPDNLQSDHVHKRMKLSTEIAEGKAQRLLENHQYKLNENFMESVEDQQIKILKDNKDEFVHFGSDTNTVVVANDMGHEENFQLDYDESFLCNEESNAEPVHPLTELRKLVGSGLINRQIAARNVLDTLTEVVSNEEDLHTLLSLFGILSNDSEFVVRVETVAQVPQIATFCREHPSDLESVIRQQLVPLTVRRLTDQQNQVRKASQLSLLALLEKGMVDDRQLTEWICPLVIQLSEHKDEEVKTEAISLMCKMAPLVGKDITLKFFLEHIASFCVDSAFSVRQVCSVCFGDVCKVVGTELTENILLQKFLSLCEDSVWGVRKNCADVFMDVSSVVTSETRNEILPNAFVTLLCDESRWVRLAAYQALGAVIATFADPLKTGLKYCEDGTIVEIPTANESHSPVERELNEQSEISDTDAKFSDLQNAYLECLPNDSNFDQTGFISSNSNTTILSDSKNSSDQTNISSRTANACDTCYSPVLSAVPLCNFVGDSVGINNNQSDQKNCMYEEEMLDQQIEPAAGDSVAASEEQGGENHNSRHVDLHGTMQRNVSTEQPSRPRKESNLESPFTVVAKDGHLHLHIENESNFNNFQFWRVPVPDLELDIDIKDGKTTNIHIRAKVHDEKSYKIGASDLSVQISPNEESCTDSVKVEASQTSPVSAGKLDIQTACMNTVIDDNSLETGRTGGGITVVNSCFNEASVVLNQVELSEVKKLHNRLLLQDYDTIFQSRCRLGFADKSLVECDKSAYDQDVVPPRLLEYYVGMVDSIQSQTVDVEITRLCARSFPAVVYTLGRKHWPCVKRLCDALSKDMQWKVRKTIAACLHELGGMLGSEITSRDLLPVYVSFLQDLDEVRIGVLSHLPEFLKLLKPSQRREFLPLMEEFIKMDNERNWRYRCVLAQQLGPMADLFSPRDVEMHVIPLSLWLITDKVSEVRLTAARTMAVVLKRLSQTPGTQVAVDLVIDIHKKFRASQKWHVRQMYALLCEQLALEKSFPHEVYVKEVVPTLFNLIWDNVPNVRIAVARCLAQTLLPLEYFPTILRMHYQLVLQVMSALRNDNDRDVQYFAHVALAAFPVSLPDKQ